MDANSLYPYAMTQPLPSGLYTKCELAPTSEDRVRHVRELAHYYAGNTAYFVEVTFTVPERLHDFLDYAPLAKGTVEPEWLSELTRESVGKIRNEKLYPTLDVNTRFFTTSLSSSCGWSWALSSKTCTISSKSRRSVG